MSSCSAHITKVGVDLFWHITVAMKARHRLLLEKIVNLISIERDVVSCGLLLKLLKVANIVSASKAELVKRVAWYLKVASVSDLLAQ